MTLWVFERFGTGAVLVVAADAVGKAKTLAESVSPGVWAAITELDGVYEGRVGVLYNTEGN